MGPVTVLGGGDKFSGGGLKGGGIRACGEPWTQGLSNGVSGRGLMVGL